MEGIDTVFHLASFVDLAPIITRKMEEINVQGTLNVIRCCQERGVKRLVYTSTIDAITGRGSFDGSVEGDDLPYPAESEHLCGYAITKVRAEQAVRNVAKSEGNLAVCVIRPVHIYGPNDILLLRGADATKVVSPITWPRHRTARLSMVFVKNVAHGHYMAAEALRSGGGVKSKVHGQVYMIGEGVAFNTFEYLEKYARAKKLGLPAYRVPGWLMAGVAAISETVWRISHSLGIHYPALFTRFVAHQLATVRLLSFLSITVCVLGFLMIAAPHA